MRNIISVSPKEKPPAGVFQQVRPIAVKLYRTSDRVAENRRTKAHFYLGRNLYARKSTFAAACGRISLQPILSSMT